jgi:integrase
VSANFRQESNKYIYLYHWQASNPPFKISTKIKLEPNQWDKVTQQPTDISLKDAEGVKVTDTLAKYRSAFTDALAEVKVTHKDLKKTFLNKLSGKITRGGVSAPVKFLAFYSDKLRQFEEKGKSNLKVHQATYNKLCKYFGRSRPSLDDLDIQFYRDFTRYMEKEGLKMSTIATVWDCIKYILGEAVLFDKTTNTKFKSFQSKYEEKTSIYLTLDELDKIYNLDFKNHPDLEKVRDLFIIGAFTGLRFSDWNRVSSDLIENGIFKMKAKKTGKESLIPCNRYVLAILKKYNGTLPKSYGVAWTDKKLRIIGMTARLNKLVEINPTIGGKKLDVPKKVKKWTLITSHTARRSLATNCIKEGASPYEVMKITGHKTLVSLNKYINLEEEETIVRLQGLLMFQ